MCDRIRNNWNIKCIRFIAFFKVKRLIIISGILLLGFASKGQQQSMYTQYMFNGLAINPAYAGSHETVSLTGLARIQWLGVEGAPRTQTFSIHTPIPGKRAALGALFSRDEIGVSSQNNINLVASYRIKLPKGTLSMGLQGGFRSSEISYADLGIDDPNLSSNISGMLPNIGTGIYYYNEKFYAGFSVPTVIKSSLEGAINSGVISATEIPHFFATSGIVLELSPMVKLKPSTLIKYVSGAPLNMDINTNLILDDKLWLGVSYRSFDAVSFLLDIQASPQFKIGYAYDYALTDIAQITSGSHEIMLNYRFVLEKSKIITPRYF